MTQQQYQHRTFDTQYFTENRNDVLRHIISYDKVLDLFLKGDGFRSER